MKTKNLASVPCSVADYNVFLLQDLYVLENEFTNNDHPEKEKGGGHKLEQNVP